MSRNFFIYVTIVLGALAISLDFASVDLALPALERQFNLDFDTVQWVINGYVLAFAVLMVAGGRLADTYGRKRVFLLGAGLFALASFLGGLAWSGPAVIAFRVLQGVGAALLWPAMIGMSCAAVGETNRGFALGLIFGTCSLGNAAGPIVGGALTQWWSWRWVLWVNVPMALLAMIAAVWNVPKDAPSDSRADNDYAGMATLTGGLVALMVVVYQADSWGWASAPILILSALALILLVAFPIVERRIREPLVPLELMRSSEFLTLCLCACVICEMFFIVLLYFTQYSMKFLGDDPMWAGARVVQFMLTYGLVSYFGGPLYGHFGARKLLLFGLACGAIASIFLGFVGPGASWLAFNGLLILLGLGVGTVIPTVSTKAIETAGIDQASLASGITFMCQLAGAALLLAVSTLIFSSVSGYDLRRSDLHEGLVISPTLHQTVQGVIAGSENLNALPVGDGNLAASVTQAYRGGLQAVLWFSAAIVLVTFFLVLRFVREKEPALSPQ